MIVGIDPGKEGAFVQLSMSGRIEATAPMPLKPDGSVDYQEVKRILATMNGPSRFYLERAVSFGMGGKSAFNYGMGFSVIQCALLELGLAVTLVEPRKWAKEIFQGIDSKLKPKEQGIIALERLFPVERSKIPVGPKSGRAHPGMVDALFIAEFGRRQVSHLLHS